MLELALIQNWLTNTNKKQEERRKEQLVEGSVITGK
jgi:hypothetical protein